MEDDRGAGGCRAREAATHGEEEHRCRANAAEVAGWSSCGAGSSSVVNDKTNSTTVVTRSGEL